NPTPDYELPVIHLYQKKTPGKFWKLPIVSEIRSLQNEYCHIKTQMKFTRKTSGNLTAFVEGDTQISVEQMKDYPGITIRRKSKTNKNGADNTRFEGALRTPETSLDWQLKQVKSDIQDILQLYDVYSGRNPSNVTAGIALSQLSQEIPQNLSREVKNCENQISQIINLGIKTVKINYSDERLADLIGEEFDFYYFKNLRDSLNLKIKLTPFSMMPADIISKRQYFLDLARFAPQYLQTIEFDDLLADTEFGGIEDRYAKREKIISKALKECRKMSECFDKNGNIITPPKLKVDLFDEHKIEFKVHKEYLASKEWELKKEFIIKNISIQLAIYIEENLKQHLAIHEQGIMSLQAMRQPQLLQPQPSRQVNDEPAEAV
nr:hypothetical protein [bacterium]